MLTLEGNIIKNNKVFRGRIEIDQSGMINKIGSPTGEADFIFGEELIFPGFIDLHVHAREDASHTEDYKEDFKTAGEAAINGGVVAFAEMPNNPIPPKDDISYGAKTKLTEKSAVEVLLYGGIGRGTEPLSRKVPYKVFMGKSVGDLFFETKTELEETLKNYSGQYVSFHAEDPEVLAAKTGEKTHELRRPPEAEWAGIEFALKLIEKYKIFGKICHVSTREGLQKILEAKARGVNVTVEVAPHHLYFSNADKILQVNPPIRDEENRKALIAALKSGQIDYLATDHAPHTREEKTKGVSGLPHLDTYGLFATWLIKEHNFNGEEVARVCAENPGKFWDVFTGEKIGKIEEGYAGSLTILDMSKSITVDKKMLKTKCGWSPFEGVTFPGSVVMTIIKGTPYQNKFGKGQEVYKK
ncbi:MAG: amidohydrolase family protein [Candidatus Paceibacterota bacterium]